MQYITEKKFTVSSLRWVLLLATLPQVLRIALNLIYEYFLYGNNRFDPAVASLATVAADFLGVISLFAGLAAVVYLVFLDGMREGGEWIIALIGAYGLAVLLLAVIEDPGFGVIAFSVSAAATLFTFFTWMKGNKRIAIAVTVTLFLAVIGGMVILLATTVPSVDMLLSSILFGLINFGLELLLMAAAARIALGFRRRAIAKGGNGADISIGNRLLPKGNPVLRCFLVVDGIYAALLTVSSLIDSISLLTEYGLPVNGQEWFSLFEPYIEIAVLFVLGYAVMLFMAARLENAFIAAEE